MFASDSLLPGNRVNELQIVLNFCINSWKSLRVVVTCRSIRDDTNLLHFTIVVHCQWSSRIALKFTFKIHITNNIHTSHVIFSISHLTCILVLTECANFMLFIVRRRSTPFISTFLRAHDLHLHLIELFCIWMLEW